MAKRIDRKADAPVAAGSNSAAADDLDILHPERELSIAGRVIVIREYGFVEGLKMRALAKPFMDALYAFTQGTNGRAPGFTDVEELLIEHADAVVQLIARAADIEPEWIGGLSDEDGFRLMQEWWLANSGFFIRRVVQRLATERAVARLAGQRFMTPSSAPATDPHPQTSADSPPAS